MSAARPRPPAPPPRGSPGGERLLLREPPLPCVVGVPLPAPRPAQPSPAPTRRFDYKTALGWQLHPGVLLPLFQPGLGSLPAFWLPLLFSSALGPGDSPLPPSYPRCLFPNYVVSQAANSLHTGRLLECPSCLSFLPACAPAPNLAQGRRLHPFSANVSVQPPPRVPIPGAEGWAPSSALLQVPLAHRPPPPPGSQELPAPLCARGLVVIPKLPLELHFSRNPYPSLERLAIPVTSLSSPCPRLSPPAFGGLFLPLFPFRFSTVDAFSLEGRGFADPRGTPGSVSAVAFVCCLSYSSVATDHLCQDELNLELRRKCAGRGFVEDGANWKRSLSVGLHFAAGSGSASRRDEQSCLDELPFGGSCTPESCERRIFLKNYVILGLSIRDQCVDCPPTPAQIPKESICCLVDWSRFGLFPKSSGLAWGWGVTGKRSPGTMGRTWTFNTRTSGFM